MLEPDCVQEFVTADQKQANESERQREAHHGLLLRQLSEVPQKLEGTH